MLSNVEIKELIEKRNLEIANLQVLEIDDPNSPIQPASIDLTIGSILKPTLEDSPIKMRGGVHNMRQGETVLVTTKEILKLPSDIGGLMFPKNGDFATRGVLITNFGHVDPGYEGPLRFTVINFGKYEFRLEIGDRISSLTLFKLEKEANPSWSTITRTPSGLTEHGRAKALSPDFLDIERRINILVEKMVPDEVTKQTNKRNFLQPLVITLATTFISICLAIATIAVPFYTHLDDKIEALKHEQR